MPINHKPTKKRELLVHTATVSEWEIYVFTHGATGRANPERVGMFGMHAKGNFSSALNGITAFDLTLSKKAEEEVKESDRVGAILTVKPEITGIIELTDDEFAAARALATWDRPVYMHLAFDKPHYGIGTVRSFSISTRPIE